MHAQDDLNLCILCMFEDTFSLDADQIFIFPFKRLCGRY